MLRIRRRPIRLTFLTALAILALLAGCRSAPDAADLTPEAGEQPPELTPEEQEIIQLERELSLARTDLADKTAEADELRSQIAVLEEEISGLESNVLALLEAGETEAVERDVEIETLRAEREALLLDMERLSNAAQVAAVQAATAMEDADEAVAEAERAEAELEAMVAASSTGGATTGQGGTSTATAGAGTPSAAELEAFAEALDGLGGFRQVTDLGFTNDRRLASRLAVASSGLSVDSSGEDPVLYDNGISFDSSLIYLTITDPAGNDPRLTLTVQYVSDIQPLYAQTAFISIEGNDPIDPVDPVIFTGNPERETDGTRVREAFSREVDRQLLARISGMLSNGSFSSTFVGTVGRDSHRPTAEEREALSRVLFAYIDLGGYR